MGATAFSDCDFLTHAFCTRRGGISKGNFASLNFSSKEGDSRESVETNLRILAESFNIDAGHFFMVTQVHGEGILILDRPIADLVVHDSPQFDAVITDQPGIAIGIKTADCVPIFFADRTKRIIAVAHAGWRGTSLSIAAKVIDTLRTRFTCRTEEIIAAIGPAIGPCCYQVDETVFSAMSAHNGREIFFSSSPEKGKWMFDLSRANKIQMIRAGLLDKNIYTAGYCTSCNRDKFYSHRGEGGNTGRQFNFIMLNKKSDLLDS